MNRLGWALLALFLTVGAGFWLLLDRESPTAASVAPPAVKGGSAEGSASPLLVPVAGVQAEALVPTFDEARGGGIRSHGAIDIMAPRGTPVVAAMPGTVERLFDSVDGGLTAYVRSDDGRWIAYYAHLDGYAPGLAEGQRLMRGGAIGTVGSTGNAEDSAPHLHFALHRMAAGEGWSQGTPVDPYPALTGRRSPAPPPLAAPPGAR